MVDKPSINSISHSDPLPKHRHVITERVVISLFGTTYTVTPLILRKQFFGSYVRTRLVLKYWV